MIPYMVAMWEVSGSVSGAVSGVGGAVVIPLKVVVKAMWNTTSRHDIVSEIGSSTRREGSSKSSGATED